jgi:hypothetical protein
VATIEILYIALTEISHKQGACALRVGRDQKVYMICHQAICMHLTIVFFGELAQVREVHQVIAVLLEACHPIVSALDDMRGYARKNEPRWSRHNRNNGLRGARLTDLRL